jgi:hypothetical protein
MSLKKNVNKVLYITDIVKSKKLTYSRPTFMHSLKYGITYFRMNSENNSISSQRVSLNLPFNVSSVFSETRITKTIHNHYHNPRPKLIKAGYHQPCSPQLNYLRRCINQQTIKSLIMAVHITSDKE